jgi:hypothetical protein
MKIKNILILVGILLLSGFCCFDLAFSNLDDTIRWCRQFHDTSADLDAGNNRHIIISNEACGEMGVERYYSVKEDDKILVPESKIDYDMRKDHDYGLIYAENKSIVGVIDDRNYYEPFVLAYDFATKNPYPDECDLWRRLKKENPNIRSCN